MPAQNVDVEARATSVLRRMEREVDPQLRVLRTELARVHRYLQDIECMMVDNATKRLKLTDRAREKFFNNRDDPSLDDTERKVVTWDLPRGVIVKQRSIRDWLQYFIDVRVWTLAGERYEEPIEPWADGKPANEQPGPPEEALNVYQQAKAARR